jgi:SEC-C motif-containing protein
VKCPCGSADYEQCCGRYHAGAPPPSNEALMRSRYSAFALQKWGYLAQTQVAPFGVGAPQHWVGLTVHEAKGDEVEFTARYVEDGREYALRERSTFAGGKYVTGAPSLTERKLSRNDPCPCGSGKKVKACG